MNRDIKDNLRWRTGVVLENKNFNSTAVVRADNEAKRINIYVKGRQKRDYFAVILQRFREINNSVEKLKAIEKIPLPDEPEVTVGYEHLIKLELRGIETYMPDGSDNEYRVSELLGTVISGNGLMEILKEIKQKTEVNEKEILKILQNIQKIESETNVEDSKLEKLNRSITLNPKSTDEIFELMINRSFTANAITFNVLATGLEKFNYDEEDKVLTIDADDENTNFDIIDGFHRSVAICRAMKVIALAVNFLLIIKSAISFTDLGFKVMLRISFPSFSFIVNSLCVAGLYCTNILLYQFAIVL
jgi:hypothetical protein